MSLSPADRVIDLYDNHAAIWAERRDGALIEQGWLDAFLGALPEGGREILDLGCGSGTPIAGYCIGQGGRITGVDAAAAMIDRARQSFPDENWIVADMRALPPLGQFHGIIAWHSFFHLCHEDQRQMFQSFGRHAAPGAALMFTSGPEHGEAIGEFEGRPLYHASLDAGEYRELLHQNGFEVLRHVVADETCGKATIWLAKRSSPRGG